MKKRLEYEFSYAEIAEIMGVSTAVVEKIEREALVKIKTALEDMEL